MAIKIVVPSIPQVKIPEIPNFSNVKVDTTGIQASVKAANQATKEIKRSSLFARLAPYKAKTVSILGKSNPLSETDKTAVTKLCKDIKENGWLDAGTENWCKEQGINI